MPQNVRFSRYQKMYFTVLRRFRWEKWGWSEHLSRPFLRADKMAEHVICCSCSTCAIAVHRRKIWCMLTTLWKHTLSLPGLGISILNTFSPVLLKETVYETIMTVWDGSALVCCFICLFANIVTSSVVSNDKVTCDQRNIPKPKKNWPK
jgi:hypothetical protein